MFDLGDLDYFFILEFNTTIKHLIIKETKNISNILKIFNMLNDKSTSSYNKILTLIQCKLDYTLFLDNISYFHLDKYYK